MRREFIRIEKRDIISSGSTGQKICASDKKKGYAGTTENKDRQRSETNGK
tara:strand:- start:442 stop:591 length:150 start_codon:yes stop_codon:yes gene_type:complete